MYITSRIKKQVNLVGSDVSYYFAGKSLSQPQGSFPVSVRSGEILTVSRVSFRGLTPRWEGSDEYQNDLYPVPWYSPVGTTVSRPDLGKYQITSFFFFPVEGLDERGDCTPCQVIVCEAYS
jgi:hypothetical protein